MTSFPPLHPTQAHHAPALDIKPSSLMIMDSVAVHQDSLYTFDHWNVGFNDRAVYRERLH